jgi:hypothetical protein
MMLILQGEKYEMLGSLQGIANTVLVPTTKGPSGTYTMYGGNVEVLPRYARPTLRGYFFEGKKKQTNKQNLYCL